MQLSLIQLTLFIRSQAFPGPVLILHTDLATYPEPHPPLTLTMPSIPPLPTPTPHELQDLIYYTRTADLSSLQTLITSLSQTHQCTPDTIIASAIDVDEDGLGSQSCLLHYAAANGWVEGLSYLLSLLQPGATSTTSMDTGTRPGDKSAVEMVNHKNVSGNTPLHWAAMNGMLGSVRVLVGWGADVGVLNAAGRDAVVEAEVSAREGWREVVGWLERNAGLERGVGGGKEVVGEVDAELEAEGEEKEDGLERKQEQVNGSGDGKTSGEEMDTSAP
jgi:uncharacterized protein